MSKDRAQKIIIAEDEITLCNALAEVLSNRRFNVIGKAQNGLEVIKLLKTQQSDLVLMDIRMPQMDGIEATEFISKNYPTVKVLMLSTYNKEAYVQQAIEVGAKGYILKNTDPNDIAEAIKTIAQGSHYFSPGIYNMLAKRINRSKNEELVRLSNKEKQILHLLSEGFTSDEVSVKMSINEHSVKSYRRNMFIKFNAKNIAHLIGLAFNQGHLDNLSC